MKTKLILISLSSLFSLQAYAQSPNWLWANGIGGTGNDEGHSIVTDASGNIYTTGFFTGTVDFDPGAGVFNLTTITGGTSIFISKLDDSGNFVWAKAMGGSFYARGFSLTIDVSGNVYSTGFFRFTVDFDPGSGTFNLTAAGSDADIFISKLDNSGNFIWAKAMGGIINDVGYSIAIDVSGNVYTTGYFEVTADFDPGAGTSYLTSAGQDDIFISKLDSSGNFVWAKAIGGTDEDYSYSIAIDASDNVYTTGYFSGTADFDPGAAVFNLTSAGGIHNIFISKLDSSGNFAWAKAIGGIINDVSLSIAIDAYDNVCTTGFFNGTVDFDPGAGTFNLISSAGSADIFVSKLDSSGNFVWAKAIGGTNSNGNFGQSIAHDASGNVYTTGEFSGTIDFDPGAGTFNLTSAGGRDIFISKLDSSGNFVWAKASVGTGFDYAQSITLNASGNVYVTGYFYSLSISFGPTTLTNADNTGNTSDIFIVKLDILTGIENIENTNGVFVYPNPSGGEFRIQAGNWQLAKDNKYELEICNVTGEKIYVQKITSPKTEINLSNQPNGIYFLHLRTENNSVTQKLIIQ